MKIYLFCYAETEDKYCDFERLSSAGRRSTEEFGALHFKSVRFDRLLFLPHVGMYAQETLTCLGLRMQDFPEDSLVSRTHEKTERCIRRMPQHSPGSVVLVFGNCRQQNDFVRSLCGNPVFLRKCECAILKHDGKKFTLDRELRR